MTPKLNGGISVNRSNTISDESPDNYGNSTQEANDDSQENTPKKKKLKKRKRTKFHNDRKAKRKRLLQISAILAKDVINKSQQKEQFGSNIPYSGDHLKDVLCYFCKLPYGPMMKLSKPANTWGHLSCAFWLPNVAPYMPDRHIYISIKGFKELADKKSVVCAYCKKNEGLFLKCFEKICGTSFHVECARRSFCELKFPNQLQAIQNEHAAFCYEHSQTFNTRKIDQSLLGEKSQMKTILKNFASHHNFDLHFDFKAHLKKNNFKRMVIYLKRIDLGGTQNGFEFIRNSFE